MRFMYTSIAYGNKKSFTNINKYNDDDDDDDGYTYLEKLAIVNHRRPFERPIHSPKKRN